ncbi:hypothetical protein [Hymenobacter sp. BT491]|uniref:hypothetical protein n=1 Tax=Hymenobacter sp. BT491 TaxID=2766779 RepID=UPI001653E6E5|nr:hypothetical protein [Hymenobacter sp. BT491]MBC6988285.1 hypothetical protein [Hymenobacter sp. BT491]
MFFLVPFYTGTKKNVIPVYESSHYFQGYIAQGFKHFYRPEFTHYFFVGDDLILTPAVNERNYQAVLGLDQNTSYIPEIITFHNTGYWSRKHLSISFYDNRNGSEGRHELPAPDEALARFAEHNITLGNLGYVDIFGKTKWQDLADSPAKAARNLYKYYWRWRHLKAPADNKVKLPYPVVFAYSDIAIVSAECIQRFSHLCGVLSAQGLFVEIALPTALLLSAKRIITNNDLPFKGVAMWTPEEVQAVSDRYGYSLKKLIAGFPEDVFYYHPIKLSQWHSN